MVYQYKGNYHYDQKIIGDWNSCQIGVYYCGYLTPTGALLPVYIGQGVGSEGIRGRLLQHVAERKWPDVTHFGYAACDSAQEAAQFEAQEIRRCQPKYNIHYK